MQCFSTPHFCGAGILGPCLGRLSRLLALNAFVYTEYLLTISFMSLLLITVNS